MANTGGFSGIDINVGTTKYTVNKAQLTKLNSIASSYDLNEYNANEYNNDIYNDASSAAISLDELKNEDANNANNTSKDVENNVNIVIEDNYNEEYSFWEKLELDACKKICEVSNTVDKLLDAGGPVTDYAATAIQSFSCAVVGVFEDIGDGIIMTVGGEIASAVEKAGKEELANDIKNIVTDAVDDDWSEELYQANVKTLGVDEDIANSWVHTAGSIGGSLVTYMTIGNVLSGFMPFIGMSASTGSSSEMAFQFGATFEEAKIVSEISGIIGFITGGFTDKFGADAAAAETMKQVLKIGGKNALVSMAEPIVNSVTEYFVFGKDVTNEDGTKKYNNILEYYKDSGGIFNTIFAGLAGFGTTIVGGTKGKGKIDTEVETKVETDVTVDTKQKVDGDVVETKVKVDSDLDIDNTSNKMVRKKLSQMSVEERAATRKKFVDDLYRKATEKAQGIYNDFFKNFREHTVKHTNAVADYAVELGKQADLPAGCLVEVEYAGKFHDLGMNGGVFKGSDGNYYDIDSIVRTNETTTIIKNGKEVLCYYYEVDGKKVHIAPVEDSLSLTKANLARSNHPLNSAMEILKYDLSPDGLDNEVVALLAMTHSKSTSGIKDFSNSEQWMEAIDKMVAAVKKADPTYDVDALSQNLKSLINNEVTFKMLQDQALVIRDGDAMADVALDKNGNQIMQTDYSARTEHYRLEDANSVPETTNAIQEAKHIKDYLVDPETGLPIENGEITNEFSKKTHAGEMNTKYSSTYKNNVYEATIEVVDPLNSPASTLDAAFERVGEVVTYGNTESRKVVIELPAEYEGTPLGDWYVNTVREKSKKAIGKYMSEPDGLPPDTKKFYGECVVVEFK